MLQRRRRKDNISPKSHPSLTFINNLLHSKSTYFYNGWGRIVPTFCILALLVGLYSFINPTTRHDSNSIRIDSSMLGLGSNKAYASDTDGVPVNNNNGVMSTRASDNNVSMTITPDTSSSGGSSSGTIDATVGQTAYSNHIVKLTGDRIKSYVLSISYTNDSTALVNNSTNTEEGAINSTITGANDKTGDNLDSNTWGYSWSDNTSTSSNTLTYHTMPISTNPATIKSATEGTIPNNTLDMTGKLAFAVKFGEKAVAGHYTTNVLLSLAIQPAEVVFDGITTMQQMTADICKNAKENDSAQLTDTRDNKKYWVTKLKDGNCWMTQNLAYNGGGTSRGTGCSGWTNDNTVAQYCSPGHTDGDHASRGNYYSWPAAMNGNTSATGTVQGICPNGWHLPTSNSTAKGSFGGLTTAYGAGNNSAGSAIMRGAPMYFQYSGYAASSGINYVGSYGYYWSSTPGSSSYAYILNLGSNGANPSYYDARYYGYSVRCLALTTTTDFSGNGNDSEELFPDPNYPDDPDFPPTVLPDSATSNVAITVSPVISIDATSGMSSEVDFTTVAHGDITATISSNQKYQVLLSTNQSTLEQSPIVPNHNIPMITTDTTITPGTRAWGIQKTNATLYSPIGIGNNKVLFYESLGAESKTITFPVAISVDSTLPSGTYATEVTITATAN